MNQTEVIMNHKNKKQIKLMWWLCVAGLCGIHRIYNGFKTSNTREKITGIIQFFTLGGLFVWQMLDYHLKFGAKKQIMLGIGAGASVLVPVLFFFLLKSDKYIDINEPLNELEQKIALSDNKIGWTTGTPLGNNRFFHTFGAARTYSFNKNRTFGSIFFQNGNEQQAFIGIFKVKIVEKIHEGYMKGYIYFKLTKGKTENVPNYITIDEKIAKIVKYPIIYVGHTTTTPAFFQIGQINTTINDLEKKRNGNENQPAFWYWDFNS